MQRSPKKYSRKWITSKGPWTMFFLTWFKKFKGSLKDLTILIKTFSLKYSEMCWRKSSKMRGRFNHRKLFLILMQVSKVSQKLFWKFQPLIIHKMLAKSQFMFKQRTLSKKKKKFFKKQRILAIKKMPLTIMYETCLKSMHIRN
jgi:hypothetical protein